jgi:hypothetical protein
VASPQTVRYKRAMFDKLLLLIPAISLMLGAPTVPGPLRARAEAAAKITVDVAQSFPLERREQLARMAYVFQAAESGFVADPKGSNDQGAACGAMQVHTPYKFVEGATCAKVRADYRLGVLVGMTLMNLLWDKCGSPAAALTAYSTNGQCPGTWVLPVVSRRCKIAGLSSDCRLPGT